MCGLRETLFSINFSVPEKKESLNPQPCDPLLHHLQSKNLNELNPHPTCCSVLTGFVVARCKLYFAVLSCRVRRTLAGIRSVTRVEAGATVFAGTMIGAEVEICKTCVRHDRATVMQ